VAFQPLPVFVKHFQRLHHIERGKHNSLLMVIILAVRPKSASNWRSF
jgi:hypothetical protein